MNTLLQCFGGNKKISRDCRVTSGGIVININMSYPSLSLCMFPVCIYSSKYQITGLNISVAPVILDIFYSKLAVLLVFGVRNWSDYFGLSLSAGWLRESWFSLHLVCGFHRYLHCDEYKKAFVWVHRQVGVLSSEVWLEKGLLFIVLE